MLIFHIRLRLCYHFLSIFLSLLLFYSHLSQALLCYLFSLFCSSLTLSTKSLLIFDLSIDKLSVFSYDSWPCALLNRQSLTFWLSSKLPSSHNLPFSISVWHISFFWFTFSLSPSQIFWHNFLSKGGQIFNYIIASFEMRHLLSKNCCSFFLGNFLEKIGLIFIPTFGHTSDRPSPIPTRTVHTKNLNYENNVAGPIA